jgi:hypothetical protein
MFRILEMVGVLAVFAFSIYTLHDACNYFDVPQLELAVMPVVLRSMIDTWEKEYGESSL